MGLSVKRRREETIDVCQRHLIRIWGKGHQPLGAKLSFTGSGFKNEHFCSLLH